MASTAPVATAEAKCDDSEFLKINTAYPGVRQVRSSPPIFVCERFLTHEECDHLIKIGGAGLKRSIVVDGREGKTSAPSRTSSSCFLNKTTEEWLHKKVKALTTKAIEEHEPAQVAMYTKSQLYAPHFDAFDLTTEPGRKCAETGGQRVATVLIYLNTVERGGGTYFPTLNHRFNPVKGNCVIFFPCKLDGSIDKLALHTGEAAVDEKWVSQVWIRERRFG